MNEATNAGDQRGPRSGGPRYRTAKPKRTGWRRFVNWKTFGFTVLGFAAAVTAGIGVAFAVIDVPAANDFSTSETTIVYFDDGKTEIGRFSAENREMVGSDEIPATLKEAVVAAEDRTFYDNAGFSISGMTRAAIDSLRGSPTAGGGSTITQQYVKNYYLTQDRELTRKLRELVISVKIDQEVDKDQILADYLNTIWFGRGTYGVQTASKAYFGVDVGELDLAQSAALAAILRSPTRYDPTLGPQNAERFEQRFRYVLDGMVDTGAIDETTAEATQAPEVLPERRVNRFGGSNGHLLMMVREELLALGYDEEQIETGGLRVTTTFNPTAQSAAVHAVRDERPTEDAERVHVGLAAVRPNDGAVLAAYGGEDAVQRSFNDAVDATPNAGSTLKPFTLAAGLENGYSLRSRFAGNSPFDPPELGPPVNNQNDEDYGRRVTLERALERSVNTAFVDLAMTIGSDTVIDAMTRAGVPADAPSLEANPRVTLGIAGLSAVDMANSYATLAAQGMRSDTYTVGQVADRHGAVSYEHEPAPRRAFTENVMADVTYALSETARNGTATAANELDRPVAAKTGTHEDKTAWFSGYTPQVAASVVYFRGDGTAAGTESLDGVGGMRHFSGGAYPGRTWAAFMETTLSGQPELDFPEPANIESDRDDNRRDDRDERESDEDDDRDDRGNREGREERDRDRREREDDRSQQPTPPPDDEDETGPPTVPVPEPTPEPEPPPTSDPPDKPTGPPTTDPTERWGDEDGGATPG